jgi:thiamine pyrophosphokinase
MYNPSFFKTVIVADGTFPSHRVPLEYLKNADRIICSDGAADNLVEAGFIPDAIVGDMDSLSNELRVRFSDRIFPDPRQDTNDLTKTVAWCIEQEFREIVIVAATGKREDHTIGNISLLAEYVKRAKVIMVTDTGIFIPAIENADIQSFPGQQVSVFSIDPSTEITSSKLLYPLDKARLANWWCGTLNEATGENFTIEFTGGPLIIYLQHKKDSISPNL